jgi:hypothetical protein
VGLKDGEEGSMTADEMQAGLQPLVDEITATAARRYFKTGPGQYGEGDVFLGIKLLLLRNQPAENAFVVDHYHTMSRTMLRYAIERFTPDRCRQYLQGAVG